MTRNCNVFVTFHAFGAALGRVAGIVRVMTHAIEIVRHEDRARLAARDAIFVISASRGRVFVTGPEEGLTRERVAARLGRDIEVVYCGDVPCEVRPRACVSYAESDPGCLDLRYVLEFDQQVVEVAVVEDRATVVVLGLVCGSVIRDAGEGVERSVPVYLSAPLGDRAVIDAFTREPVPGLAALQS